LNDMCGINGFITKETVEKDIIQQQIDKMNSLIVHRGPDDNGIFIDQSADFSVAMGMQRLSIIDLTSGHQPMFSDDKNIVIVFNGEIYNFLKLKQNLIEQKVTFNTTSDTEVILKLYEKEGISSFNKLDGMYAFSIY